MATEKELSDLLASIEKRAFKQAAYAVRRDETDQDIVQRLEQVRLASVARKKAMPLYVNVFQRVCAG